jgi:hypothetical protein
LRAALLLAAFAALACAGVTTPPTALVEVEPTAPIGPCCTVDDVIEMTASGVEPGVITDALYASGLPLDVSSDDIVRMSAAGVARPVIDAIQGGPYTCTPAPRPAPRAAVATPSPVSEGAPALNVTAKYSGGRTFELMNLSTLEYTNLVLVANGEYQYRLKRLPPGSSDNMRLVSFVSRQNGQELKDDLKSIAIRSDQGSWSKGF